MTDSISQGIAFMQAALLVLAVVLTFTSPRRGAGMALAWSSTLLALLGVGLAAAVQADAITLTAGTRGSVMMYGIVGVVIAGMTWIAFRVITSYLEARRIRSLESPQSRSKLSDELREVLRGEGIELDGRLRQAEHDREQFLYALEERHARQIAGLAQEYQHEAHTILQQLLDQLAAQQLQPMVEQRLAEQRTAIESELGAIDSAAAGETLTSIRAEFAELFASVEQTEQRIAALKADNPDASIEQIAQQRLDAVQSQIDERLALTRSELDAALASTVEVLDGRINEVGALLDERVELAGNPLANRMAETERIVEARLAEYDHVLAGRFAETEDLLNQRIVDQESGLEQRVVGLEAALDQRLGEHAASIEGVLAQHDEQLHVSLTHQGEAVAAHIAAERDRLIAELTEHTVTLQEQVAAEMAAAEAQARSTVEATQVAWNHFSAELEERFAETREEAMRAAHDIAASERETLERELQDITQRSSSDIAEKVETLGREAAWQRAQVERTVAEQMDLLRNRADDAVANADTIFADLDRIGAERVAAIRSQAEDALVQSRDYVGQLQTSLGSHLEVLRERSGELADEMNERLGAITATSQDTAARLEAYAHEIHDATSRELSLVAEQQVQALQTRLQHELATSVQATLDAQHRAWEGQLTELAQRIVQSVQGDLTGIAEHARGAVAGELEQVVAQSRDHALRTQEQAHLQVMNELARQSSELSDQARRGSEQARSSIEQGLRDNRRQLEEAMASMGAHMREELVRFNDEGQRRVEEVVERLRRREQDMIREEDRKLTQARGELVRQHEGALQQQMHSMMNGLSGALTPAAGGSFTAGIDRPTTPLGETAAPRQHFGMQG